MSSAPTTFAVIVATGLLCAAATPSRAESPAAVPESFTVISPVFGQLVRFSMPSKFVAAFENTKDAFYIREAGLKGETVNQWSQMITITANKGLASAPNYSPQNQAGSIAGGFKKACPDSFAAKSLGETKFGDRDAFVAVARCGKVEAGANEHSETALIVAVKGASDAYTIQWAERAAPISGADIDEAKWQGRFRELLPIRLCAIVSGEAAPYPSCLQQK
ncbi:hypothetical protein SAMN05444159_2300 [Bradyrhizobium lablabi]|uniref:Uncharacterized protein n=1 Tax=Bradyrhizobium lablabi TaxID=722472 RepID=A0A1M6PCK2_9BRAD|nr:hypothetical protein [Bradyrhizobium lablabi]SHK05685.1 hypothetical protein SAMN05444159_2300 [Bradyrhizobium lablabi]